METEQNSILAKFFQRLLLKIQQYTEIDNFIRKMRSKINDIIFEWIPYSQFVNIEEISKDSINTVHSAIWKDGPLCYRSNTYIRISVQKVVLKSKYNSQNAIDKFLNEVRNFSINLLFNIMTCLFIVYFIFLIG